ncbi:MAG TPA: leucine-rich repeat domain-containing protein [Flavisolibacter sp.]|jgi:Leucine-rich repeat (LRR) protein|nr:leucine-rich repeat domain-containing protein [Flavisolibacter sp.]
MKRLLFIFLIFSLKSFAQKDTEVVFKSIKEALVNPTIVKSLDLSDQQLKQLPAEIIKLTTLEKIDIGSNPDLDLVQTFEVLKQIPSLKILWLTDGKIKALPNNISQLKNLEELWLDDNELTSFPDPIKQLTNLKYLRLFSNKIKKVNFKKGQLPNLIYIDLCYNEFETFPVELSVLPNLKRIIIWYNSISTIPRSIKRFKAIEEINLQNNRLTSIPNQFGRLKTIQKLSLRDNKLSEKTIKGIYELYNLKDLDLQGNDISVLSDKVANLKQLERLSVCDNPLNELPVELEQIKTIQQLGLGDLHSLNWTNAFAIMEKLPNLKRVGMYTMKLPSMPLGFDKLQQVDTFWLTFNSFDNLEKKRIQAMVPKAKIDFE